MGKQKSKSSSSSPPPPPPPSSTPSSTTSSDNFLGSNYPYYKNIKSPDEMGMSSKGTMNALSKDVDGLIDYIQVLVSGKGKASKTGHPLGNKYFLDTKATCTDSVSGAEQPRYIYINNVPSGDIPFLSAVSGTNFTAYRGLLPGVISNLNVLNPQGLMNAFTTGPKPACQSITMETIDNNNTKSKGTYYVALADIKIMDPCSFPNGVNPVTKAKCKQGFENMTMDSISFDTVNEIIQSEFIDGKTFPLQDESILTKIYLGGLAGFALYSFYKISQKS